MAERLYALERLYEDQEPDLVSDTIPAVLAWLGATGDGSALSFSVRIGAKPAKEDTLRLAWDGRVLEGRCGGTLARALLLLDDTDGALRGVEVAGRSSGGHGALRLVLEGTKDKPGGKRAQLVQRSDIAEAHVSLWCAEPRVSLQLQVKP